MNTFLKVMGVVKEICMGDLCVCIQGVPAITENGHMHTLIANIILLKMV